MSDIIITAEQQIEDSRHANGILQNNNKVLSVALGVSLVTGCYWTGCPCPNLLQTTPNLNLEAAACHALLGRRNQDKALRQSHTSATSYATCSA